jgi:hypothetical protein
MALLVELGAGRLVPEHIRVDLARKHKLFLGTSLRGWVERWFFGRLGTHPMFRTSAWAICRSPSPLDVIRWERLGVELYDMELRDFLENLISVS